MGNSGSSSLETWNVKKSSSLYNVAGWSNDFFAINEQGRTCVTPKGPNGPSLDLYELVGDLVDRGLRAPILLRFPDIVEARVRSLAQSFHSAFQTFNYQGKYRGVYPIKVNQQRHLVEAMLRAGQETGLGIEAGSKPELLAALSLLDNPEALTICNGFKDKEYIETALLASRLGRNIIVVIDRYQELPLLLGIAKSLDIKPRIGFRAKLENKGAGKWVDSSGPRSKFGLTALEIVEGVEVLKKEGMLDCLQLLHFHIGSQITSIRPIKDSLQEACRIYADLYAMGAKLQFMDVGGGLGVDYDGSKTNWENSLNYSEQEYANDVVSAIQTICEERELPHPDVITESGRALTAHHAVLVFNVLGTHEILKKKAPEAPATDEHEKVQELWEIFNKISLRNMTESYHDTIQAKEDSIKLFNLGYLTLKDRAAIEGLFWAIIGKIQKLSKELAERSEDLEALDKELHDTYYCNFSVFQSAPDHWAVRQLFPVMPIHRLEEEPTRRATFVDLTCDSDGKIDRFIDIKDVKHALEVHPLKEGEEYYLGVFLLGAYQEILGDMHNLFGDTDAVYVSISDEGYEISHIVEGDTVTQVLEYVEYFKPALMERMRFAVENALKKKTMTIQEGRKFLHFYEQGLDGYTYLEGNE
ncbi:MAG: biosynthetic arginine decarboxylase [Proteobacteria bacterium]|nr:MAG: biosynthetic arginine decarboxylase [Pseudomonadota bacterium]